MMTITMLSVAIHFPFGYYISIRMIRSFIALNFIDKKSCLLWVEDMNRNTIMHPTLSFYSNII